MFPHSEDALGKLAQAKALIDEAMQLFTPSIKITAFTPNPLTISPGDAVTLSGTITGNIIRVKIYDKNARVLHDSLTPNDDGTWTADLDTSQVAVDDHMWFTAEGYSDSVKDTGRVADSVGVLCQARAETTPVENPAPTDNTPTDNPSSENPPATENPPSDTPTDTPPTTENPPSDTPTTEDPPSDTPSTDNPHADNPTTENPPTTDTPPSDTPTETSPATDNPPSDTPTDTPPTTENPPATDNPPVTDNPAPTDPYAGTPAAGMTLVFDKTYSGDDLDTIEAASGSGFEAVRAIMNGNIALHSDDDKVAPENGYFEIRAKFPLSSGEWVSNYFNNDDAQGADNNQNLYGGYKVSEKTAHSWPGVSDYPSADNTGDSFAVYGMRVTDDEIITYVDGVEAARYTKPVSPQLSDLDGYETDAPTIAGYIPLSVDYLRVFKEA